MSKFLKPLVMMQLKDKIDMSFLQSKKKTISKVVLSVASIAIITAVIYLLLYVSKLLKLFHLIDIIPVSVIVVVFTVMQLLSIISCTYGIMKSLYFSKDNQVLLTLPVTNNQVFFSKIIVYYLYEVFKNLYFLFPLFFAYGLISGFSILYYLWMPICLIIISAIPVVTSAFLSIFAMLLTMFLRNFSILRILLFASVIGVGIWGVVTIISAIPADLDIVGSWGTIFWAIQDFLNAFVKIFYPFTKLTQLVVGTYSGLLPVLFSVSTIWILLSVFAYILVMLALSFITSRPLFFKMASKPFEYKKSLINKEVKNKKHSAFVSALKKETLVITRSSDEIFTILSVFIVIPIAILLLNKIFASMSTRLLGDYMTVSFNLLIILLIALASNSKMASVFSRDGNSAYLIKTMPNKYIKNLVPKLVINATLVSVSIIISAIVFKMFNSLSVLNVLMFTISAVLIYLAHLLWSAEMDIMNPQTAQYATTGGHISNPNETKSTIATFFLAFAFFGISLFLSMENVNVAWLKICAIAVAFLVYRVWSFVSKIKYYYKEK